MVGSNPKFGTGHNLGKDYRIAGIFRGYKFSRMDHYKRFRGFYFRGSSLLAHAHINIQLYLHTVSLESIILNTPTIYKFLWV